MNVKRYAWLLGAAVLACLAGVFAWRLSSPPRKPVHVKKPVTAAKPSTTATQIVLYYPSRKYLESGNDRLLKLLPLRMTVGTDDKNPAETAVRALQNRPPAPDMINAIRKDLKIIGVRVEKGIAYVNFSGRNMFGGSLEETMLIQSVVRTLTGMKDIRKVQFLVDGEKRETLMGHISTAEPIGKDDI